jgi:hypothetical protein
VTVNENATIALPINVTPQDADDVVISIIASGVPTDAMLADAIVVTSPQHASRMMSGP